MNKCQCNLYKLARTNHTDNGLTLIRCCGCDDQWWTDAGYIHILPITKLDKISVFADLSKLDHFLGLPIGFSRNIVSHHDRTGLELMNMKLSQHGLRLENDTSVPRELRPKWKELMQSLHINQSWWFDGDPTIIDEVVIDTLPDGVD